jgi:hypothetical protein
MNGEIHAQMVGKKIAAMKYQGPRLIIETECGHSYHIIWRDDAPVLDSVHCRVVLTGVESLAVAAVLGGS